MNLGAVVISIWSSVRVSAGVIIRYNGSLCVIMTRGVRPRQPAGGGGGIGRSVRPGHPPHGGGGGGRSVAQRRPRPRASLVPYSPQLINISIVEG